MSDRATRHPYRFVAALEGMVLVAYLAAGFVAQVAGLPGLWLYAIANSVLAAAVAVILTVAGWWRKVGLRAPRRRRDLLYFLVPFLPVIINVAPGVQLAGAVTVTGLLLLALLVGFVEESVFRGLMLTALSGRGAWHAIIVTSVLFGLTHLANVLAGASAGETISQVAYSMAFGVAFAALALRKGIIWPLVLAHFAIDAAFFLQAPGFELPTAWTLTVNVGAAVLFTVYGLFVMRRKDDGAPAARQPTSRVTGTRRRRRA